MKKHHFIPLWIVLMGWILSACEHNNTAETTSSVAQLTAFSLAANDSMPGLAAAKFSIDERVDTGLVWNKDSILYGTSLEKVVPKFSFKTTVGAAWIQTPDTTIALIGNDTIDLSRRPVYLRIQSSDGTTTKVYEIRATVHQCDPDLYTWEQYHAGIYPTDDSEQGVVWLNSRMVLYKHNGLRISCTSSANARTWEPLQDVVGLPNSCRVRQIISDTHALYYGEGHHLYQSEDGIHWTHTEIEDSIVATVMYWNGLPWVAVAQGEEIELATIEANQTHRKGLRAQGTDWPVSGYASVGFESSNGRPRALILGGYATNGKVLNSRWQLEYSPYIEGGYRMLNFANTFTSSQALTGTSVIWYNQQLMMFGGIDHNHNCLGREVLVSHDEGVTWAVADTTKNQLPEAYTARYKQSALTDGEHIYLIGGQDATHTYSDVYCGRLNSITWNK